MKLHGCSAQNAALDTGWMVRQGIGVIPRQGGGGKSRDSVHG